MVYQIKKPEENVYLINEEYGYRFWIWFDDTNSFKEDKLNEYANLVCVREKYFPGRLFEVSVEIIRSARTGGINFYGLGKDEKISIDESTFEGIAYGFKTKNGYEFFSGKEIKVIGVDCAN